MSPLLGSVTRTSGLGRQDAGGQVALNDRLNDRSSGVAVTVGLVVRRELVDRADRVGRAELVLVTVVARTDLRLRRDEGEEESGSVVGHACIGHELAEVDDLTNLQQVNVDVELLGHLAQDVVQEGGVALGEAADAVVLGPVGRELLSLPLDEVRRSAVRADDDHETLVARLGTLVPGDVLVRAVLARDRVVDPEHRRSREVPTGELHADRDDATEDVVASVGEVGERTVPGVGKAEEVLARGLIAVLEPLAGAEQVDDGLADLGRGQVDGLSLHDCSFLLHRD